MVYNLYKKDGPEAKAGQDLRNAFNNTVGKAAKDTATDIGTAAVGAVKTLTTPQRMVVKPLVQPLVNANKAQNAALNRDAAIKSNRDNRAANAELYGNQARVVGGSNFMSKRTNMTPEREKLVVQSAQAGVATPSAPVNQSLLNRAQNFKPPGINPTGPMTSNAIPFNPNQGVTLENSTAARAMQQNANDPPTTTEYGQGPNGTFTRRQIPLPQRQLGQPAAPTGKTKVGNLDVAFSPETDSAARKAFLANPVRPTAQINRFNAMRQAEAEAAKVDPIEALARSATMPTGGSNWIERKELRQQAMQNAGNIASAMMGRNTQLETAKMSDATARDRNLIERLRANTDMETSRANTDINRMNVTGQNEERGVNVEAKRMELTGLKKNQGLLDKYLTEQDPTKKKALEGEYLTAIGKQKSKYQIVTKEDIGENGMPIKKSFAVNPDNPAESFEIGGQGGGQSQAPQKAITDLMKNPKLKEDFRRKYGYLPDGV